MLSGIARPYPISTTRIDEAFVHELPEQLVGLIFAQALFSPMRARVRLDSTLRRQKTSLMEMCNVIQRASISICDTISIDRKAGCLSPEPKPPSLTLKTRARARSSFVARAR